MGKRSVGCVWVKSIADLRIDNFLSRERCRKKGVETLCKNVDDDEDDDGQ